MKLTQLVYYVPYSYPRWSGCMRPYRRIRLKRDDSVFMSRKRTINKWFKESNRIHPKMRTNPFKHNVQIRKNFGSAYRNKWY